MIRPKSRFNVVIIPVMGLRNIVDLPRRFLHLNLDNDDDPAPGAMKTLPLSRAMISP